MRAAPFNKDKRVCRTCDQLQKAYLTLVSQMPLDKISVAALCRAADINRSTFYQHYDDLTDLQDELFVECLQEVDDLCRVVKERPMPQDQVMHMILDLIQKHQILLRAFVIENTREAFWNQLDQRIQDLFWSKLSQQSTYYVHLTSDEQENILVFLTYGFYAIFRRWLMSGCKENIESLTQTASALTNRCIKVEESAD